MLYINDLNGQISYDPESETFTLQGLQGNAHLNMLQAQFSAGQPGRFTANPVPPNVFTSEVERFETQAQTVGIVAKPPGT
jgi:hypothetical protein